MPLRTHTPPLAMCHVMLCHRLRGLFDLRPALEAAVAGACLNAKQLEGVANTLETAMEMQQAVCATDEAGALRFPALAQLTGGIQPEELATLRALRVCVKVRRPRRPERVVAPGRLQGWNDSRGRHGAVL